MVITRIQIVALAILALYFFFLLRLLVKKKLELKYTLLWMAFGVVLVVVAIFPRLLSWCAGLLGFELASNSLFAILHFCTLVLLISMTAIVSKLNGKVKQLTQVTALLERRIRELEEDGTRE